MFRPMMSLVLMAWPAFASDAGMTGAWQTVRETHDGRHTENIELFSRDDSKAGMSLELECELPYGAWHHIGHGTKGDPMHEIWSPRSDPGI